MFVHNMETNVRKQFDLKPIRSTSMLPYPRKCKNGCKLRYFYLVLYMWNKCLFSDYTKIFPSFERNDLLIKASTLGIVNLKSQLGS